MATNSNGQQSRKMTLYDAANTSVVIDGTLLYGFKGGSAIFTFTWDNDRSSIDQDSYGSSVVSRNHKDSGTLTINLNITSPMNEMLSQLCLENKVFASDIRSDTDHISGAQCVITKLGDVSAEDQAPIRTWTIHFLNADYEFVGNKA